MAGMTDQEIAEQCCCRPLSVHWFEHLFFNVRDRLGAECWITKTIRDAGRADPANKDDSLSPQQRATVIKQFAYFGGPLVLDAAIRALSPRLSRGSNADVSAWFNESFKSQVQQMAIIAVASVDQLDAKELFRLRARVAAAKKNTEPSTVAFEPNIDAFFGQLPDGLISGKWWRHAPPTTEEEE